MVLGVYFGEGGMLHSHACGAFKDTLYMVS